MGRPARLLGDRTHDRGMGIAKGVDRDAGKQIEVAFAVLVPHVNALAALDHQLRLTKGVHHPLRV